ncbi:hypothetical protein GTA62_03460 [Roseobacter sp. HKCCD9010]|nr:hypothetical protein [Rhodobacterales bacterium HKCCD4356]NNV11075.1 hypothetical protein [Roseobacter sp. HKCCD7357]NNV15259.1 hypothetical protein [Roseobacter sp. HKCCD8768]NNV24719.1 hypothetical protein [Roseobacter sp. HKCCD8192]NNV28975.1 hypothetical protein [Roseobacter sp. HKCCD9061]NNV33249.1 hypothetical protein [Roseobacter sp. HKCCD9073]NNV37499.1 hypothetical protein [Roseobacter sp. HKCCD9054]NNV41456.1 hypothetical protein [Roseobacter sp. HKCCD6497]NNV45709.1 hypothetic
MWTRFLSVLFALALGSAGLALAQGTEPTPRPETPEVTQVIATMAPREGPVTGFPLPRYVSMKASEGNARRGPSRSHRIDWVFQRRNMPMMIVAEHGHWRRVVDRDGAGGWMHYSLLSGVRTAIVEVDMLEMHQRPDLESPVRAQAELGVIGRLEECNGAWCQMSTGGHRGWVPISALWGVEPGEVFD